MMVEKRTTRQHNRKFAYCGFAIAKVIMHFMRHFGIEERETTAGHVQKYH